MAGIKIHHRILCAGLATMIAACSTYSGQKLGTVDDKPIKPNGIPYNLVRPEYTITRTAPAAGQKKPTYSLAVSYQPDPTQRYSLKVSPGIFANTDFVMKLTSTGTLAGTTTTFTEQLTPAITAFGTLASNVIGAAALLDKNSIRGKIKLDLTGSNCSKPTDVPHLSTELIGATVSVAIISRLDNFKDDAQFMDQFHYITELERVCLGDVLKAVNTRVTAEKVKLDTWESARTDYLIKHPLDSAFVDRLTRAVKNEDSDEFTALAAVIAVDAEPQKSERDALYALAGDAATALSRRVAQKQLDFIVNMDVTTWRARNLLYLEREIDRITALRLKQSALIIASEAKTYLESLRRARAATLDAVDLYDRSVILATFIQSIRDKTERGGTAPATAEFAIARGELDNVLAQIDVRRARLLSDAAAPPPPPIVPLQDEKVARVDDKFIAASKLNGWFDGTGKTALDYVLVLTEVP